MSSGRESSPAPRSSAAPERPLPSTTRTSWWSVPMRRASSRALRAAGSAASSMSGHGRRPAATGPPPRTMASCRPRPPRPSVAAPALAPERRRDEGGPPDRLRQRAGHGARTRRCASPTWACAIRRRTSCGRSTTASRGRWRASTARSGWCSCRARRPTWSRRSSRSRGARSCAGRSSRTSAHRCRWRRPTPRSSPCTSAPNGTPPSTGAASPTIPSSRSTPGRPAPSGSSTRRGAASPSASPTCAPLPTTTATPARSRVCWPSSTWDAARCSRCSTTGRSPSRPRRGATTPRTTGRCART